MPDNYLLGHERVKIDESVPKMPSLGHGRRKFVCSVPGGRLWGTNCIGDRGLVPEMPFLGARTKAKW